jgi:hypothetical protein
MHDASVRFAVILAVLVLMLRLVLVVFDARYQLALCI